MGKQEIYDATSRRIDYVMDNRYHEPPEITQLFLLEIIARLLNEIACK